MGRCHANSPEPEALPTEAAPPAHRPSTHPASLKVSPASRPVPTVPQPATGLLLRRWLEEQASKESKQTHSQNTNKNSEYLQAEQPVTGFLMQRWLEQRPQK